MLKWATVFFSMSKSIFFVIFNNFAGAHVIFLCEKRILDLNWRKRRFFSSFLLFFREQKSLKKKKSDFCYVFRFKSRSTKKTVAHGFSRNPGAWPKRLFFNFLIIFSWAKITVFFVISTKKWHCSGFDTMKSWKSDRCSGLDFWWSWKSDHCSGFETFFRVFSCFGDFCSLQWAHVLKWVFKSDVCSGFDSFIFFESFFFLFWQPCSTCLFLMARYI